MMIERLGLSGHRATACSRPNVAFTLHTPLPLPPPQIYYWQHIEPSAVVSYATLAVVDASGASRTLQLSMTHYLPASHDPSGACSALAAADAAGASAADAALPAWSTAALVSGAALGSGGASQGGVCWQRAATAGKQTMFPCCQSVPGAKLRPPCPAPALWCAAPELARGSCHGAAPRRSHWHGGLGPGPQRHRPASLHRLCRQQPGGWRVQPHRAGEAISRAESSLALEAAASAGPAPELCMGMGPPCTQDDHCHAWLQARGIVVDGVVASPFTRWGCRVQGCELP